VLEVREDLPRGLLNLDASNLHRVLPGPTLIHLPGRQEPALFVSVLLHGNEPTGLHSVQMLLSRYRQEGLPRALSLFIGNVSAARHGQRRLPGQPDYNRIWLPGPSPEHEMMQRVLEEMRSRGVFASVDVHNNTGTNPHYACVNRLDHRFFHLAVLFGRTVVYFTKPAGVQSQAFAELCPAVTVEAGQAGQTRGVSHVAEYLEACLHLLEFPEHPVAPHDMELFHSVATVRVPESASLAFGEGQAEMCLAADLDRLNFSELPPDTYVGKIRPHSAVRLSARDEQGREVGDRYFAYRNGEIRTRVALMPSMFTLDEQAIRLDCLGYLMERHLGWADIPVGAAVESVKTSAAGR
jgi:succinylglutamate desuccinylase